MFPSFCDLFFPRCSFFLRWSFPAQALWAKWDDHTLGHWFTFFPIFGGFFIRIFVTVDTVLLFYPSFSVKIAPAGTSCVVRVLFYPYFIAERIPDET